MGLKSDTRVQILTTLKPKASIDRSDKMLSCPEYWLESLVINSQSPMLKFSLLLSSLSLTFILKSYTPVHCLSFSCTSVWNMSLSVILVTTDYKSYSKQLVEKCKLGLFHIWYTCSTLPCIFKYTWSNTYLEFFCFACCNNAELRFTWYTRAFLLF